MSRTIYLPVTGDLTGLATDGPPPGLLLRSQAERVSALPRTIARQYFPFSFDYLTDTYGQADQIIADLGVLDPVELWERCGPRGSLNAPDDFIATLSIRSGDDTGTAEAQVIDSGGSPRRTALSFPGAGATHYGIPLFTGDRILVVWSVAPLGGTAATVILNLTEGDQMPLQRASAAWELA